MLRENKPGIFANLILVILMSASICQTLYTSLFMTNKLSSVVFIAVVPLTLLFFVMFKSKMTTIVSVIVISVILILGLSYILFKIGIESTSNWIYNYSTWLIDVGNGYNDMSYQLYTNLTIIALAFIITLFVFVFSVKIYNFYVICILLLSVFFVQLQFNIFSSKISFILFIFSFLLYYFFDILRRRSKEITYDVGHKLKYLIYIIPVCAVVIAISFLFPIKSNRIVLPWLDTKIDSAIKKVSENVSERINAMFLDKDLAIFDYFSLKSTGFGKEDKLGGNINPNKTHVMNVKSEYSNLYLKATSKAFYDGHGWYDDDNQFKSLGNTLDTYSKQINSDSNEFVSGNFMMTGLNKNDKIYTAAKADIEYVNIKTKSLFIPVKLDLLTFKTPLSLFYDNEQMISASEIQSENFDYTIEYNNIMLSSDEFKKSIQKSYKGYYTDYLENYLSNHPELSGYQSSENKNNFSRSSSSVLFEFEDQMKNIYDRYTQLPETVTPRVRQLAQDLTKDKGNSYDKAKAIETYLSSNYPYTLKPGNPPRRKDFVDYFLFEGKKGYCTYYASAMTVLLRCIDIPTRYVEGYILPPDHTNGVFKVTNQQAHAWVEVYFEGFGWIPFEPTAPFVANMYNDKNISESDSSGVTNSGSEDYLDMINRYSDNNTGIVNDSGDIDTTPVKKTNTPLLVIIIISSIIGVILLAFGILAIINMFRYYITLRRIRKVDPNRAVLMAYTYILKVLRVQNILINAGETPSQFGIRVEKTLDFNGYSFNKTSFTKITNHYVNARYSIATLLKNDQQEMLDFITILLQLTNDKMGKIKFAISRYVLGKI